MNDGTPKGIDRRTAIKWVLAATATVPLLDARGFAATQKPHGYGTDPKLMESYKPGALWPLTFTPEQRATAAALCELIIPADEKSPSAKDLHVHEFIDEWISAPYRRQEADRKTVVEGLDWLDSASKKRFKKSFVDLGETEKRSLCDEICFEPKTGSNLKKQAAFFSRFRDLTTSGFYTTPEGMKDVQYIGNIPLTQFDGPPPEVLAYLKLA